MTIIHRLPAIDQAIWNKAGDLDVGTKRKAGRGRHHNGATVPDATILEIRRMHEIERKPMAQVVEAYPQFEKSYVRRVLGYEVRANLRVKP